MAYCPLSSTFFFFFFKSFLFFSFWNHPRQFFFFFFFFLSQTFLVPSPQASVSSVRWDGRKGGGISFKASWPFALFFHPPFGTPLRAHCKYHSLSEVWSFPPCCLPLACLFFWRKKFQTTWKDSCDCPCQMYFFFFLPPLELAWWRSDMLHQKPAFLYRSNNFQRVYRRWKNHLCRIFYRLKMLCDDISRLARRPLAQKKKLATSTCPLIIDIPSVLANYSWS